MRRDKGQGEKLSCLHLEVGVRREARQGVAHRESAWCGRQGDVAFWTKEQSAQPRPWPSERGLKGKGKGM